MFVSSSVSLTLNRKTNNQFLSVFLSVGISGTITVVIWTNTERIKGFICRSLPFSGGQEDYKDAWKNEPQLFVLQSCFLAAVQHLLINKRRFCYAFWYLQTKTYRCSLWPHPCCADMVASACIFVSVCVCVLKLFDQTNSLGRSSFYWRWHKFWNFYAVTPVCQ